MDILGRVAFFCALFTLQCCVSVLGNISRDTIFLRSYKASSVAALTLLLSFTTAYALTSANQLLTKLAQQSAPSSVLYAISPAGLAVGLLALALTSLCAPLLAHGISVAIYIWLEISAQLLNQQFWDLCAKAFDVSQSKKYFGFITFGTTFGSLIASFIVLPALQKRSLPTEYNLIIGALLQMLVAGVLYFTAEIFAPTTAVGATVKLNKKPNSSNGKEKAKSAGDQTPSASSASSAIISEIQGRNYLKHICFFDMLATVVRVLVDNTTLSVLSLQQEDEVKASLTKINAVQSFLMIPMQLASGPFFTRFGVMYGISMLPVSVFLFGASTYASNSVYSLVFTRALYNAISLAIFNPARELLWLPFNASERSRFKSFVCGPFRSLSRIFGAVLSMFLTAEIVARFLGASSMSVLMTAAAVAWFVDALAARQSYAAEFYSSLRQGYLDLTSPLVDFTPDQIVLVKETLVAGAQNQVNYVLSSLSHEHIGLFSQELRALFYKKNRDGVPVTPLHTKLRLLSLHTAAKRQFVLHAQESYFLPDSSTFPSGIFNTMDLMMMIKDKSLAMPRQLRVAAILASGYEKFNADADKCSQMLSKLVQSADEDKSVVVCAAVALLRLSDWMDEEANVVLQRLLHEEKASDSRVVCLKIVGKELPELLGDGFLVYLLHHSSPQIVQAAVESCSHSSRNSRMLIPALVKHLSNSTLRPQVVAALKWFDPVALWATLSQYTESVVRFPERAIANINASSMEQKREALAGSMKVLEASSFPLEDKLSLLLSLIDTLIVSPTISRELCGDDGESANVDILHQLFSKDAVLEELVVDALLTLISTTDEKVIHAHSQAMSSIHHALNTKIRQVYEMRHVLKLFNQICPRTATNIEETSPLLLQHVEHSLHDTQRLLLKLLSTGFPKEFNVAVILEGLQSDTPQVLSAIQEVLESLLPGTYKNLVLPLLFPQNSSNKSTAKIEREVTEFFAGKNGVGILLDVLKHPKPHAELSSLALQYFLHIAADHAEFLDGAMKTQFETSILPQLVGNELAKELLVETYHSRPEVLSYESVPVVMECEPPLISRIAISNCLRYSSLFENVCAIGILRVLSHHFVPIKVGRGESFAMEGDLASAMYVVASGTVQLHKERRILAELGYGACIGQASLLMHNLHAGKHVASATALSDCILLSVSRNDLDALMKETPRVSRGVLNAVASSLRWLYFEPLHAIAQSGSLPRRDRTLSLNATAVHPSAEGEESILKATQSLTSNLRAVLSVDRAAKSFLYNIGRARTSEPGAPMSAPSGRARNLSFQGSPSNFMPVIKPDSFPSRSIFGLSDALDYTNFEKCICLKGSQLMKNLDDDKVSLVAQLSRVTTLNHGDTLYVDGTAADSIYVVIDGSVAITQQLPSGEATIQLHDGDCFGEESFVPNTNLHGNAVAVGRVTLFEIPTKDLIDLSEHHHDIMHVILAWMAQKLANSTEKMVAPMLSPINTTVRAPTTFWESEEETNTSPVSSETRPRKAKSRAETD
ncbi:hypothetical protein Gpo141_00004688 [Globisporangium polare]